ncbi:EamA family transporter [Tessaracoccus sp. MC1865]|uniref:EamA family transporter n=1 Tax=Tessaracoccus sp. MC1865 TaxID=2760310 RepID=UPI0016025D74|nr:EamA family transporter [Tessaracoccus sp. MC1865]MBB1482614.1 EamA family transporter [Tessaracoccus sp. MC1865]QTO37935.1 EamA family transporter [Tessaracoccus sp. MC1865]
MVVVIIWGINFLAVSSVSDFYPPLLGAALRFVPLALLAMVFLPKPRGSWRWVVQYGLWIGTGQFGLLYVGMAMGVPPGLASVVVQISAPLTVLLASLLLNEPLSRLALVGTGVALGGIGVIAWDRMSAGAALPLILVVAGAASWAGGNVVGRMAREVRPLHLAMWMTVVPPVPLLVLSVLFEGTAAIHRAWDSALTVAAVPANIGLLFTAFGASGVAYILWTGLLARNPSSRVAPFSLLVPVVGMLAAWLVHGEVPTFFAAVGGALLLAGAALALAPGLRR